jgi:hypothetical protein
MRERERDGEKGRKRGCEEKGERESVKQMEEDLRLIWFAILA